MLFIGGHEVQDEVLGVRVLLSRTHIRRLLQQLRGLADQQLAPHLARWMTGKSPS